MIAAAPRLRIERDVRGAVGERMEHSASVERDLKLYALIVKRREIEPLGLVQLTRR